jgi:hypothetical protein
VFRVFATSDREATVAHKELFIDKANAINLSHLNKRALEIQKEQIQSIKDFAALHPDHPFTKANKHVLDVNEQTSWNAAGLLSMTGLGWWALNLSADLAPPNYIIYNATGIPDWSIAPFTSTVAGYFLVDPSKLKGEYDFQLQSIAGVLGEVSLSLYKSDGTQIATFFGVVAGLSLSLVTGTGTLKYNPV